MNVSLICGSSYSFPWRDCLTTTAALLTISGIAAAAIPPIPPTREWVRQHGTTEGGTVLSLGVSADALGNVFTSGWTNRAIGGTYGGSGSDAYVSKYDAAGNRIWTNQIGTFTSEVSRGVSADGLGNVHVVGEVFDGAIFSKLYDVFLRKYNSAGDLVWARQFGSSVDDEGHAVSSDGSGNVYVSGVTAGSLGGTNAGNWDAYVSKIDIAGNVVWSRQIGTNMAESAEGVSADHLGNVYVSGYTEGTLVGASFGLTDAFLRKYDGSGNVLWTRQFGSSNHDVGQGVSADRLGNVFVCGSTQGNLAGSNAGSSDGFVRKYDASGNHLWTRQFGTSELDMSLGVSADHSGNVYVTGRTAGSLGGAHAGLHDVFVSKYDGSGNLIWIEQFGTDSHDNGFSVSTDGMRNIYVAGDTRGNLGVPFAGGSDAFLLKFSEVPEPKNLVIILIALGILVRCRAISK
jgi:hypothetical protein